jgi:hypothetical protein
VPAETELDVWEVVFRNRLVFPACDLCWGKWPDDWKRFPECGFGRWPEEEEKPTPEFVTRGDFNDVPASELVPGRRISHERMFGLIGGPS